MKMSLPGRGPQSGPPGPLEQFSGLSAAKRCPPALPSGWEMHGTLFAGVKEVLLAEFSRARERKTAHEPLIEQ